MDNLQLQRLLNETLSPHLIKDYAPNGLQIEGCKEVQKIVTGVTASQALIDKDTAKKAELDRQELVAEKREQREAMKRNLPFMLGF